MRTWNTQNKETQLERITRELGEANTEGETLLPAELLEQTETDDEEAFELHIEDAFVELADEILGDENN